MRERILKLYHKINRDAFHGPALVTKIMLFILTIQLGWWIIFFQLNQEQFLKNEELHDERILDTARLGLLHKLAPSEKSRLVIDPVDDVSSIRLKDDLKESRAIRSLRSFWMLVTETIFVVLVMMYGSSRILRSIQRERGFIREKNRFIQSVTHELKTPLAIVQLNLQTLKKRKLDKQHTDEMLEESLVQIQRLEDQLNNLLLGAELLVKDTKSRKLNAASSLPINLSDAVHGYLDEMKSYLEKENFQVKLDLDQSVHVKIRSDLFHRVLDHLVRNSILYSKEQRQIDICIKLENPSKKFARLMVSDYGRGISPLELKNIFKPLYRVEDVDSPIRGSGMGLFIVCEIIQSIGGTVGAKSQGEGTGTTIEMRLPVESK